MENKVVTKITLDNSNYLYGNPENRKHISKRYFANKKEECYIIATPKKTQELLNCLKEDWSWS